MEAELAGSWTPIEDVEGAGLRRLVWHADERGAVCELFRESWEGGRGADALDPVLGSSKGAARQVYVTETLPGVVKAWHRHGIQLDRFACLRGRVLLALADGRERSSTVENVWTVVLDPDRAPLSVSIPPGVWHGWRCLSSTPALVVNCVSREWHPPGDVLCDEHRSSPGASLFGEGAPTFDWLGRRDG